MQKPNIIETENGSLIFEWIQKDKRFGIFLDVNLENSSWFFASRNMEGCSSGYLSKALIKYLKQYFYDGE